MRRRLILCEKSTRWSPALRTAVGCVKTAPRGRNAPSPSLEIIETRSLPGCLEALAASPASLIAIEITVTNLEAAIDFLRETPSRFPNAAAVALLSSETLLAAPLLREAGAIDVAVSILDAPRLVRLARRHHQFAPLEPLTTRQFVATRLPWPAHATDISPPR